MGKTIGELSQSVSVRELSYWYAFFDLHGYPDMRAEYYGGQTAALMCTIASRKGKQHKASDFMLDEILTSAADKQEAEMRAYFEQLASKGVAKKG